MRGHHFRLACTSAQATHSQRCVCLSSTPCLWLWLRVDLRTEFVEPTQLQAMALALVCGCFQFHLVIPKISAHLTAAPRTAVADRRCLAANTIHQVVMAYIVMALQPSHYSPNRPKSQSHGVPTVEPGPPPSLCQLFPSVLSWHISQCYSPTFEFP